MHLLYEYLTYTSSFSLAIHLCPVFKGILFLLGVLSTAKKNPLKLIFKD